MERRRFNLSSMSPMADSTRIDASLISNRPSASSFLRGLSPKGGNTTLNGTRTPERSLMNHTATSPSSIARQKLNLSHIDPRTFADVHSSGLASRIVAYHESSLGGRSGLQRSMSASNLYNPLTQPRRAPASPIPYKSRVPPLSMTQIAPPERSFYSGNTLPSLLRSNSLAGVVHKTSEQEQLSRENRPILHPPHPQHESEPTRSVLEELKEISRKRINTGDAQPPHDFTKRSCQRGVDFVDHHRHQQQLHQLQQQQSQSFKRQRELTVSVPLRHHSTSIASAPPSALQHLHSNGSISPTQSPEQVAKRPNCSYNNDIASSLSSSQRHSNKRKLFDMRESFQTSRNETLGSGSSPENSPGENVAKIQRKVDAESVSRTMSMPVPAVSAVPASRSISAPPAQRIEQRSVEVPPATEKPKLTLFNARQSHTKAEPPRQDLSSPDVDAGEYAGIQFVKPKQQNSMLGVKKPSVERTHKTKLAIMLSGLKGELYQGEPDELDAPAAAPAPAPAALPTPIKPIIAPPVTTTTTTTSTSTATVSTTAPIKPVILSNQVIKPAETTTTSTSSAVPKLVFGQATPAPATAEGEAPKTTDKVSAAPAETPTKFELIAKPATPATSAQPLINFSTPKSSAPATLSFGNPTTGTITTTTTTISTSLTTSKPIFSFGQPPANGPTVGASTGFKLDSPATTAVTTTNSGAPVTSTSTFGMAAPKTTATVAPTTNPPISFDKPLTAMVGTGPATSNNSATATISPFGASAGAPAAKPIFTFGQSGTASSGTSTSSGNGTAAPNPAVFSFDGNPAQTSRVEPTSLFGSQPQTTGNSFGSVFGQPAATKPEPTKAGIFGNPNPENSFGSAFKPPADVAATTAAELPKPFGFSATTTAAGGTPAAATNLFTFGGSAAAASKPAEPAPTSTQNNTFGQSVATSTPFSFGGAASSTGATGNKDNKSVFAFGAGGDNNSAAKPSAVFSFGGSDKGAPPAFGSVATPASSASATPTSNAFGFGAAQKPSTPMFGSGSAQQAPAPSAAASKPFAFGAAQQTPTSSAPPSSGGFSFAAVAAKNNTEPAATNVFGSPANASKPSFNFGGSTVNQAGTGSPAGGFSFATPAKKEEPAGNNMFGSPNTGIVKPNFSFSGNNPSTQSAGPSPAPSFGGFGAPAAAAATAASSNQNKPFAFGGNTTAAAPSPAQPMGGNLFANAVAATHNQPKPGAFSFGGAKSNASTTAGNAPFSFGGAAAGGIASPPSNQGINTAKPFSFGGVGGNPAPSVFGSPAPSPAASNPAGTFSFGGASPAQQANAGNMFAPAPSTPEGRPIRKATRRLQK
ncbi:nuclear pore complex protein DDB_G0274915 [Drosophila biarmipes]|uniref:nuclear pore complex protein DDB_G0274915 n=1 Tax=Drosophila biarmipes TaxID=125945 RepID=UPI0007E7A44C|nr:nuclear pore complex protein DDB_G0274915 [Drosophila biarmipes]